MQCGVQRTHTRRATAEMDVSEDQYASYSSDESEDSYFDVIEPLEVSSKEYSGFTSCNKA